MQRIVALALLLSACTDPSPETAQLTETTRYQRLVGGEPDLETCEQNAPPGYNCLNWLTLCSNHGVMMVLTDILDEGRWTADGDLLTVELPGATDAASSFTLRLIDGGLESENPGGGHPWVATDDSAETLDESCASLETRPWW